MAAQDGISVGLKTLGKRLRQAGALTRVDGLSPNSIRVTAEGHHQAVWHLPRGLYPPTIAPIAPIAPEGTPPNSKYALVVRFGGAILLFCHDNRATKSHQMGGLQVRSGAGWNDWCDWCDPGA